MNSPQSRVTHAISKIKEIDFSLIRFKLAHHSDNLDWSEDKIDAAQDEYVQFLALSYAYPEEVLVPSEPADQFWHVHILDTRAYEHDCDLIFGFTLHHFPYLGIRDEDDAEQFKIYCARTAELHQRHFATPMSASTSCGSCASCASIDPRAFSK
jgi:hypothetical protein